MGKENYRGDISKDTQSESGQILFWFLAIVIGALVFFLIMRLMFRVNYKMRQAREHFRPIIGWILVGVIVIGIVFALFVFILNAVSRKKHKQREEDE